MENFPEKNYWCSCGCQGYKCYDRFCDSFCYILGQAKLQQELSSKILFNPKEVR